MGCSKIRVLATAFVLLLPYAQRAQDLPNKTDVLQQCAIALGGVTTIRSATLTGTATYYGGSNPESGNAVLSARDNQNSSVVISLPSSVINEVRTVSDGQMSGAGSGSTPYTIPERNLMTSAAWFFPNMLIAAASTLPTYANSYVGLEKRQSSTVHHIRIWQRRADLTANQNEALRELSTQELYLDSSSLLPIATTFMIGDLPVEVNFSDYRQTQGMACSYRIQVYSRGTMVWDIQALTINVDNSLVVPVSAGVRQEIETF
jgi:hypothetical protein